MYFHAVALRLLFITTATSGANFFSIKSLEPLYSNFRCYGNESSLMDCLYSSSPCTHYSRTDAAVRCVGEIVSGINLVYTIFLSGVTLACILVIQLRFWTEQFSFKIMQAPVFKAEFV